MSVRAVAPGARGGAVGGDHRDGRGAGPLGGDRAAQGISERAAVAPAPGSERHRSRRDTSLDKSAQLGKTESSEAGKRPDTSPQAILQRHARAKFLSNPLAERLERLGSALRDSYGRTLECAQVREQQRDGRIIQRWCGQRWCLACNRIRTARAIERYLPEVETWRDLHMVTLTAGKTVPDVELRQRIEGMISAFQRCRDNLRKSDRVKLVGLRKMECTWRPNTGLYHPHFHVLVEGRRAAQLLRKRWLEQWPGATWRANRVQRVTQTRASLMEVFKYFTKLVFKLDTGERAFVPPPMLDVIFQAMKLKRTYQPYGFKVAGKDEEEEIGEDEAVQATKRIGEFVQWVWDQDAADWLATVESIDRGTGEVSEEVLRLAEYEPTKGVRRIIASLDRTGVCEVADADDAVQQALTVRSAPSVRDQLEELRADVAARGSVSFWRFEPAVRRGAWRVLHERWEEQWKRIRDQNREGADHEQEAEGAAQLGGAAGQAGGGGPGVLLDGGADPP